ncbi:Glycosyltransferase involved in cell wall bisynthesis [Oryzisolibacter propanilivorax]|uniref:Glycosyltransferase involved in cell wall bisynthesis n=1 Tax=Oryzisolibacter propanilivorax TaxID=1527607 RepID=A0A1G9QQ39_9BURK|nr:glycosyltransferase [Oryzisolibacter propanilivorax]SDM13162.1 Glycosyltransferase involved in cell wall bisynthesis [Oryzisolibacter propanilivorax]
MSSPALLNPAVRHSPLPAPQGGAWAGATDAAVGLLLAGSLLLPSGYSWGAALLVLLGLLRLPGWWRAGPPLPAPLRWWAAAVLLMALGWSIHLFDHGQLQWKTLGLDRVVKYLLVLAAVLALALQPPRWRAVAWGSALGGVGAGAIAVWQVGLQQLERAEGHTNAIQFGNLALLLGLWCVALGLALWRQRRLALPCALGAAGGLLASLLSGSRGGWMALPVLLALTLWFLHPGRGKAPAWRLGLQALCAVALLGAALLAVPSVRDRVQLGVYEWEHADAQVLNTAVGLRRALWVYAWEEGQTAPLLGVGQQAFTERMPAAVAAARLPSHALLLNHAHNEWLDMFAKRGLLGCLCLLAFFAVPGYGFWRLLRQADRQIRAAGADAAAWAQSRLAAVCGLVTVLGFLGFGLTQVMFAHNNANILYLLGVTLWLALSVHSRPGAPQVALRPDGARAADAAQADRPLRVMHFVSGGFSGATQVAIDLCAPHPGQESLLVLRRRAMDITERLQRLQAQGIAVRTVSRWSHWVTQREVARLCRQWRPDVFVAHGFSEHLWGRYGALQAGVPRLLHVEHNTRERYTARRLRQSLELAARTERIVGVSQAVCDALVARGHPADKCVAILNGIDLQRWQGGLPWHEREDAIVMSARFAQQKDHFTLIRAAAVLRDTHGLRPTVYLAGEGKSSWRRRAQVLAQELGLQEQVRFLGHVSDLPALCGRVKLAVLSTHYEGLGLGLIEAMACGCCGIGTDVEGVREILTDGDTGYLVPHQDAAALAARLAQLLQHPEQAQAVAARGQAHVRATFDRRRMTQQYLDLLRAPPIPSPPSAMP